MQVKDAHGATTTCGGTSAPDGVYLCPTAMVDPYPGSIIDLLEELDKAAKSVFLKQNLVSSSNMLAQTMAVKTAKGDACPVSAAW